MSRVHGNPGGPHAGAARACGGPPSTPGWPAAAEAHVVGEIARRQEGGIEALVVIAAEAVHHPLALAAEIHRDETLVDLDHAVLQAGGDAQLLALDGEHEARLHRKRHLYAVELE